MDQAEVIRAKDLARQLGIGKSTLHRWRKQGRFPAPVQLGPRTAGYLKAEVARWLAERVAQRAARTGEPLAAQLDGGGK